MNQLTLRRTLILILTLVIISPIWVLWLYLPSLPAKETKWLIILIPLTISVYGGEWVAKRLSLLIYREDVTILTELENNDI